MRQIKRPALFYKDYLQTFVRQSGKPKVLFVWIPKNAGTSVFEALNSAIGMEKYLTVSDAKKSFCNKGLVTFGHISVAGLLGEKLISKRYIDKAHVFCVSRNPYDRFVSLFHYLKKHDRIPQDFTALQLIKEIVKGIPPVGLYNFEGISQCNCQVDWIRGIKIDQIIRFENIENEIESLSTIIGEKIEIPHRNISPGRKDFYSELDSECIKLVNDYYEADFTRFNYSMEPAR